MWNRSHIHQQKKQEKHRTCTHPTRGTEKSISHLIHAEVHPGKIASQALNFMYGLYNKIEYLTVQLIQLSSKPLLNVRSSPKPFH